jgi:predicted nucleic-acid-binding protein
MALISKKDIDVINRVFREKNILDSLHNINEQIISELEQRDQIQNTIIEDQILIIENKDLIIEELNEQSSQNIEFYSEIIKKEKCVKNSFQLTTGIGLFIILILIL